MELNVFFKTFFIIVALAIFLILIGIALQYFNPLTFRGSNIEGVKNFVIDAIVKKIYECHEKNVFKTGSVICFRIKFSSDQDILSSDILGKIDPNRINNGTAVSDDLGSFGEIFIIYENNNIYVKRLVNEGISS